MNATLTHCLFIMPPVHSWRMTLHRSILRPRMAMVLALALGLSACSRPGDDQGSSNSGGSGDGSITPAIVKSRNIGGGYHVKVGGYYTGDGSAAISAGSVVITANVTDERGNPGTLQAQGALANGHFSGSGSVMGHALVIDGRADAADAQGKGKKAVLQIARLVATFASDDGHHGRVAGDHNGKVAPPIPVSSDD